MLVAYADVLGRIIASEGSSFSDRGADRGGATKFGITQATLSGFYGRPASVLDVQQLDERTARLVYLHVFVVDPHFDQIKDDPLRLFVIDSGVQHSPRRVVEWLQWAAAVKTDGVMGPATIAAVNAEPALYVYLLIASQRLKLYGRLTSEDAELKLALKAGFECQAENTAGWCNRLADFLDDAALKAAAGNARLPAGAPPS